MNEEKSGSFEENPSAEEFNWESRVLCSDGNCIGVIGPDGRCKECGRPYKGQLDETPQNAPDQADSRDREKPDQDADGEETPAAETIGEANESDWESRVLCSDGNCIGVIGPDGRCKECGKPYDRDADT